MPFIPDGLNWKCNPEGKWNKLRSFLAPYDIVYKICHHLRWLLTLMDHAGSIYLIQILLEGFEGVVAEEVGGILHL